jgi:hypothetical protein
LLERSGLAGLPFTVGDSYHPQLSWRNLDMERQSHDMELQLAGLTCWTIEDSLTFRSDTPLDTSGSR